MEKIEGWPEEERRMKAEEEALAEREFGLLMEENARLKSENARLREALKPFADEVSNWAADCRPGHDGIRPVLRARDLVRARAALGEAE